MKTKVSLFYWTGCKQPRNDSRSHKCWKSFSSHSEKYSFFITDIIFTRNKIQNKFILFPQFFFNTPLPFIFIHIQYFALSLLGMMHTFYSCFSHVLRFVYYLFILRLSRKDCSHSKWQSSSRCHLIRVSKTKLNINTDSFCLLYFNQDSQYQASESSKAT